MSRPSGDAAATGDGERRPGTSHYFSTDPSSRSAPRHVRLVLADVSLDLVTDRGVFAAAEVDRGTRFLLQAAPSPPPAGELVDLGAGYGPIALALAHRSPGARIWAVEVNARARELCRSNAAALGLTNVEVVEPTDVPSDLVVDGLWSNPPIRIGKPALHELLGRWLDRLAPEARAWLVVQRHLGADSLARWLGERGHGVERLGSRQGYRLLEVVARA